MKNAIQYKEHWLMKGSTAYELFEYWKLAKDDKTIKLYRKKFEDHFKSVLTNYEKSIQT